MNIFLILALVALIIVIALVAYIFIRKSNKQEKVINQENSVNNNEAEKKPQASYAVLELPAKVLVIDSHSLFQAFNKILDSYKALDYANKNKRDLDKIEWHTWQISLLINFLRVDMEFYISVEKDIFHSSILHEKRSDILEDIDNIMKKYKEHVNIKKTKDELCKDIIWTSREASTLLYFIIFKKEFKE